MLSVEDALVRILEAFEPLPAETLSIAQARGRVLAAPIVSRVTQPPSDVSAMDGYAVRAADVAQVPARLTLVGTAPAGGAAAFALGPGEAVRIFTGGPLPDGADSIVIQEECAREGADVVVKEAPKRGTYVRRAGLDFRAGDQGLAAGRLLTARDIGLAAAMNVPWVQVRRRPRIAILATGDEIVMPGEPIGPNQIVSSNALALAGLVESCGGEASNLGIARDERASLEALAAGAEGADLLVTSGGASVGERDLVRQVLGDRGLELNFWKIAMRPGKPLMFGRMGRTAMLGLPGNPVSSLVCGLLFLRPAIERLLGLDRPPHPLQTAQLGADLPTNDGRQDYLRATLSRDEAGHAIATAFGTQDSSMLATLAHSDCLILRAPHAPALSAGSLVQILPFDSL